NNLRQMGMGSLMYADDDALGTLSDTIDDADDDQNWLYPRYVPALRTFSCPSARNEVRPESVITNPVTGTAYLGDLTHYAGTKGAPGSSYEVFGFMNFNGETFTPLLINGVVKQVHGTRKTLSSVQNYMHQFDSFDLKGLAPGPSRIWLILDGDDNAGNYPNPAGNHGAAGLNVEFCDGHVEWITPQKWA